ncbi:MAG: VWA domain-containing protein [Clostridium sp.]
MKSQKLKLIALATSAVMFSNIFLTSTINVSAAEKKLSWQRGLDYVLFSGNEDDLVFNVEEGNVEGDIYSEDSVEYTGEKGLLVNGRINASLVPENIEGNYNTINNKIEMPQLYDVISKNTENSIVYEEDEKFVQSTINLDNSIKVNGSLFLDRVNLSGNGYIIAENNIRYDVNRGNTENYNAVIYSKNGNITINGSEAVINGVIYAPNGKVEINAKKITINGAIYADSIELNGTTLNVNENSEATGLITEKLVVDAGKDKEIYIDEALELTGSCNYSDADITWSIEGEETQAEISNNKSLETSVKFNKEGTYTLKLNSTLENMSASDEVVIKVKAEPVKQYTMTSDFNEGSYENLSGENDELKLENTNTREINEISKIYKGTELKGVNVTSTINKDMLYAPKDSASITYNINGYGTQDEEEGAIDLILVIDTSGSMDGDRIERTKESAKKVVSCMKENDRCALVGFEGSAYLVNDFTSDSEELNNSIDTLIPRWNGTNISSGINKAIDVFENSSANNRDKYVILLSDGEDNSQTESSGAASLAKENGIKIFALSVGNDTKQLQDVAIYNKGVYMNSPSAEQIEFLMSKMANEIFNTAARNATFKLTIQNKNMVNINELNPKPDKVEENEDGSLTLSWSYDRINIDEEKQIKIEINSNLLQNETWSNLVKDASITYYDRDGKAKIMYLEDTSLPVSNNIEKGSWSSVYDSQRKNCNWTSVYWDALVKNDGKMKVYVSTSEDGENFTEKKEVSNYSALTDVVGRYVKLDVEMTASSDGKTPELYDITIVSGKNEMPEKTESEMNVSILGDTETKVNEPLSLIADWKNSEETDKIEWSVNEEEGALISDTSSIKTNIVFTKEGLYHVDLAVTKGENTKHETLEVLVKEAEKLEDYNPETNEKKLDISVEGIPEYSFRNDKIDFKVSSKDMSNISWYAVKFNDQIIKMNENNEGTLFISSNMSGEYSFTVMAFDWAGNQVTLEKKILIDNVRPTVNLVTDKTNMYSYENAEITASASDEGSGLENFKVTINDKEVELDDEGKYIFKTNVAGNYTIKAEAIDKAGNITTTTKTIYVREDTVKPTVNLSVNRTSASIGNEIIIKSSATDNAELVSFEVTLDGEKIDLVDGQYSFIADKAKDYTVQAIAKDRAGNETIRTSTIKVTEDTTKPTLSLNVNSSNVDYGDYIDISLIANDNVGIESLKLYVNDKEIKIDENNSARILADVVGNLVIKAEATDKAGNITTRTRTIKVNIDTTKPTINLNVSQNEVTCGEYVTVFVSANDDKGLESLKLYANSKEIKIDENGNAKILTDKVGDLVIEAIAIDKTGNRANEKVTVKVLEKDIINPTINITSEDKANLGEDVYVSVDAEDNVAVQELKVYVDGVLTELDGNKIKLDTSSIKTIKIKAVAKDTSGNETIEEKEVSIVDTINPIVSIETDKSSYKEGESALFTALITDNGNIAKIEAELNGKPVVLDEENKFKIDNLSVGTYTLSIKAYDESGNVGENIKVITIKDETAPTITINKEVEEYTKGQSISVNYSISDNVKVNTIQASLNDKAVEISELSGNLVFNDLEEGEYTLKIQASDEENNKSEESYNFKVVIPKDTIAPKLNVSYTPEIMVNQNGSIKINATDETELDRVELYLGETKLELNEDNSYNYTPTEAGEFTFTAKAIDKAGNESKSTFKINVKKYASEQEEFEETVAEYLVTASKIVDIYEKMGVSQENLKLLLEEAARREKGGQPLANKSNLMTNSVKSSLMTDSIEYKNVNSFNKTNLSMVKATSIFEKRSSDEEAQEAEEKEILARRVAHCLYVAKKRNYPSRYVLYLYISHYIDIPDNEPLDCKSTYFPDIITDEDVIAYEKFMSNVNMSEFADNLANFAADAYTLGTTGWKDMLNNAVDGLAKAEDMWGWFCAGDAMLDMRSLVGPMVDYIMENKFHQYARSSEEIIEYLNSSYQSNVSPGKTAIMVTGTVVFGIISGGAILMPVSVIIGAEYVGFLTDLVKIAALVGLRYGLSVRAAGRFWIAYENGEI